jgi:GNAT superfamily N-acetyltransferase
MNATFSTNHATIYMNFTIKVIYVEIRWKEILIENLFYLDKVLEIYDKSFPLEVREPHQIFIQSLQYATTAYPNNFRFMIGLDGERIVSFATGHYLADVNTGFVVYIATNPLFRSKGIGRQTLLEMEELLNKDAYLAGNSSLMAIILETESPAQAKTIIEREECLSRNRFFQKNGYKLNLEWEYVQPPLHNDDKCIPLNLFMKVPQKVHLNKEDVMKIILAIYYEKYYKVNQINKEVLTRSLSEMGMV